MCVAFLTHGIDRRTGRPRFQVVLKSVVVWCVEIMRPADALYLHPPTLYYDQTALQTGDDLSAPTGINIEALKPLAKGDDVSVRSPYVTSCHVCGCLRDSDHRNNPTKKRTAGPIK